MDFTENYELPLYERHDRPNLEWGYNESMRTLDFELALETAQRMEADTQLQENIDAEEAARIAKDAELQAQVDDRVTYGELGFTHTELGLRPARTRLHNDINSLAVGVAVEGYVPETLWSETTGDPSIKATIDRLDAKLDAETNERIDADSELQDGLIAKVDIKSINRLVYTDQYGWPNDFLRQHTGYHTLAAMAAAIDSAGGGIIEGGSQPSLTWATSESRTWDDYICHQFSYPAAAMPDDLRNMTKDNLFWIEATMSAYEDRQFLVLALYLGTENNSWTYRPLMPMPT